MNRQIQQLQAAAVPPLQVPPAFERPLLGENNPQTLVEEGDIKRATNECYTRTVVRYAMHNNRQGNLIYTHQLMKKANGLHDEEGKEIERDAIPNKILYSFLEIADISDDNHPATFEYTAVKWKRTRFIMTKTKVVYGNCPMCYAPVPLGHKCKTRYCGHPRAVKIYFVRDKSVFFSHQHLPGYDPPPQALLDQQKPCDPIGMGKALDIKPVIHFDMEYFEKKNNTTYKYDPEDPRLWSLHETRDFLDKLETRGRLLHPDLLHEHEIQLGFFTGSTPLDVQFAMLYHRHHYPDDMWGHLMNERQLRRFNNGE